MISPACCVEARRSSSLRYRHRPSCGLILRGTSNEGGILNCAVAAAGHWLTGILRCDPARQRRAQGKGVGLGHSQIPRTPTVPIPRFLIAELRDHIAARSPDDLVFRRTARRPLRPSIFRAGFNVAATAIGIPELQPHEPRHTAASLAIASGTDVKVVQRMLGHSSAPMTMDVYGHLFSDRLDEVADALDTARSEAARSAAAVANAQNPVAKVLPNADVVDLAAYKAKGKTAGQAPNSDGAPGEIRTRAPASGGRCSIP